MVKVMMRAITRFLPGKMMEGMKLMDEMFATIKKKDYGPFPPVRKYTSWIGGGNAINTIILEVEWESLLRWQSFLRSRMKIPSG